MLSLEEIKAVAEQHPGLLARYKAALLAHVAAYDAAKGDLGILARLKDLPAEEAVPLLAAASARGIAEMDAAAEVARLAGVLRESLQTVAA